MANHKSALKRIRQNAKRHARNKADKSRMRTFQKKVMQAVESGDLDAARETFKAAESVIAVTAKKGVIHKNQAARRISRLAARVKTLAQAAA